VADSAVNARNGTLGDTAVTENSPASRHKARIAELDRILERDPLAFAARAERAGLLREDGRIEAAQHDYLELLQQQPADFTTLNDFGAMTLTAGHKGAARTLFAEAVRHHPDNAKGHINLANLLYHDGHFDQARKHYEAALRIDPHNTHAHRGMSYVLAEAGDRDGARVHRDLAFTGHALTTLPYRGDGAGIAVLLLVSAVGGNIPIATLLDDTVFATTVMVAEYADPAAPLPPHDLVFNAIGDADLCRPGLEAACRLLAATGRPVINLPQNVLLTGRAANATRLGQLPHVVAPRMKLVSRRRLGEEHAAAAVIEAGFAFPLLLRAPGFHTGQYFVCVDDVAGLNAAARELPGDQVWLLERLDARDADGFYRKCRVMMIDGKLYPLHLAISRHWMVHYFRADMAASADNRAKEVAFLGDLEAFIGPNGFAALQSICAALGLDYGGIDFAVNAEGDILLFEANATMVMVPLSADPKWDYRRPAFDAVFGAIRTMLLARAAVPRNDVCPSGELQKSETPAISDGMHN
jgi:hypothetical protein